MGSPREVSIQIIKQNTDGTMLVRTTDQSPFAGSVAASNEGMTSGFAATIGGRTIRFASQEDYETAMEVYGNSQRRRGGGGTVRKFLAGGADAAEGVSALFTARNLKNQRGALQDALADAAVARDKLASKQATHPDLIPALLDALDAERDAMAAAITILDDQITNLDITAGTNAVRLVSEFMWDDGGGWSGASNSESGLFQGLAFAGVGLGLGYLLSNTGGGRRRRHHR